MKKQRLCARSLLPTVGDKRDRPGVIRGHFLEEVAMTFILV